MIVAGQAVDAGAVAQAEAAGAAGAGVRSAFSTRACDLIDHAAFAGGGSARAGFSSATGVCAAARDLASVPTTTRGAAAASVRAATASAAAFGARARARGAHQKAKQYSTPERLHLHKHRQSPGTERSALFRLVPTIEQANTTRALELAHRCIHGVTARPDERLTMRRACVGMPKE